MQNWVNTVMIIDCLNSADFFFFGLEKNPPPPRDC